MSSRVSRQLLHNKVFIKLLCIAALLNIAQSMDVYILVPGKKFQSQGHLRHCLGIFLTARREKGDLVVNSSAWWKGPLFYCRTWSFLYKETRRPAAISKRTLLYQLDPTGNWCQHLHAPLRGAIDRWLQNVLSKDQETPQKLLLWGLWSSGSMSGLWASKRRPKLNKTASSPI